MVRIVETSCHNTTSEMQMQFKVRTMLNLNIHLFKDWIGFMAFVKLEHSFL